MVACLLMVVLVCNVILSREVMIQTLDSSASQIVNSINGTMTAESVIKHVDHAMAQTNINVSHAMIQILTIIKLGHVALNSVGMVRTRDTMIAMTEI